MQARWIVWPPERFGAIPPAPVRHSEMQRLPTLAEEGRFYELFGTAERDGVPRCKLQHETDNRQHVRQVALPPSVLRQPSVMVSDKPGASMCTYALNRNTCDAPNPQ